MIEETIGQLKTMITEDLGVKVGPEGIDPDAPLLEEGLKLDSLAIVELIALSEERFGIQFGEDKLTMDSFASLRSLAKSIAAMRVPA